MVINYLDQLPTNYDVLCRFLFLMQSQKTQAEGLTRFSKAKEICAMQIFEELNLIHQKIPCEIRRKDKIKEKILKLHSDWRNAEKNKTKPLYRSFQASLNSLFDVIHQNAEKSIMENGNLTLNQRKVDVKFIKDQRNKRSMKFGLEDGTYSEVESGDESDDQSLSSNFSDDMANLNLGHKSIAEDPDFEVVSKTRKPKKINLASADRLTETLDRTNLSDGKATHVVAATAKSLGFDLNDVVVSKSTLRRQRKLNRSKRAAQIKSAFICPTWIIVHFDGKLLKDLSGK